MACLDADQQRQRRSRQWLDEYVAGPHRRKRNTVSVSGGAGLWLARWRLGADCYPYPWRQRVFPNLYIMSVADPPIIASQPFEHCQRRSARGHGRT